MGLTPLLTDYAVVRTHSTKPNVSEIARTARNALRFANMEVAPFVVRVPPFARNEFRSLWALFFLQSRTWINRERRSVLRPAP